ncbi:Hypothetical predicted protein [Marmota monax]|uniref:Uncharacterized protein n=1 Tax=Marmota monax TaxID=9995 RepID=A0A5E4CPI8_MARMO|nr:hypothetical protein GHT09_017241 [Marmota monax]VTJ82951.1 Hypothetical predicted protein [Marmota monax]
MFVSRKPLLFGQPSLRVQQSKKGASASLWLIMASYMLPRPDMVTSCPYHEVLMAFLRSKPAVFPQYSHYYYKWCVAMPAGSSSDSPGQIPSILSLPAYTTMMEAPRAPSSISPEVPPGSEVHSQVALDKLAPCSPL